MQRNIGSCPDKPEDANPYPDAITKSYQIQLITPLFGGGAKAGENDEVTIIRPSSVRGHLRFWWRTTSGAKFERVEELRQREGEIWGTTKNPSKVIIGVTIKSSGDSYPCARYQEGWSLPRFEKNHPPYVLFPFQGNIRKNVKPANCIANITIDLELTYPEIISRDVEEAIWAWTYFGGLGARTRRGSGALYCNGFAP
ncbi:MAG: type III-B CRISPR module RAMP protein Cmr1, partial [Methanothrix harundinacea]|nr:type III-B CRISPR module RAMP protein Cmr1 [Methanothrix harundinacea]